MSVENLCVEMTVARGWGMVPQIGAKLGEGAGAEVYAWGASRVVKLFRAGTNWADAQHEVHITRIVQNSGAPAPEVYGITEMDGRIGIIYPRYEGQTLLSLLLEGQVNPHEVGTTMAKIHHQLHAAGYKASLATFRNWALSSLTWLAKSGTPNDVVDFARERVLTLPESGVVCHTDLHPANIIMTAAGPRIIDWVSAVLADPLVDVARFHLTLSILFVDEHHQGISAIELNRIRQEIDTAFLSTYATFSAITMDQLLIQIEPYMPVMAALRLRESGSSTAEKAMLIEYICSKTNEQRCEMLP